MKHLKNILSLAIATAMIVTMFPVYAEETEESHGTGLQAMTEERRDALRQRYYAHEENEISQYSLDALPESIDNSNTIYFPSIADQGSTGACVAYATTYYQLSYTISKELNQNCSSYTFSPLWTYSLINSGTDNGSNEWDAYTILSDFGAPKKSEFKGTKTSIDTNSSTWKSAMKYKIDPEQNDDNWECIICEDSDEFIEKAKAQLAAGKVLTTGSNSNWWYGDDSSESVTVKKNGSSTSNDGIAYIYDNGEDEGRHLITIVGYDDSITMSYGGYTTSNGAFKIANSWGTSWGNSGYIWVAYDAFNSELTNRPSGRRGYGFVSSWWDSDDESVFYTIDLDEDYSLYSPEYVGEVTLSGKKLSDMILSYDAKENGTGSWSDFSYIYDGTRYSGLPTSSYSGTIAVDLSDMSSYFGNDSSYWEINLAGINNAYLKILDSSSNTVYPKTQGTKWSKAHEHSYNEGSKQYNSANGTWTRTDICIICGEENIVTGNCSHVYVEGAKTYNSSNGTWSRTDTCSICGYQNIVTGICTHSYIEGDRTYSTDGTWSRIDTCSICGYQNAVTGICEHNYSDNGIIYEGSTWRSTEKCSVCGNIRTIETGTCYFNMNFENGVSNSEWINNGRGVISSVTENNNTYMKIEYQNESGDKPTYFEISNPTNWYYSSMAISGPTEMSFDVKFGGIDGDVYLKQRAEDVNEIVLRICCKEIGRLQYGTNGGRRTFFDENEQYINPIDRWLHIRIIANISENADEATQTIYVTDRDTGELISTVEDKALATNVSYCNLITIGGSSTVNIDNIIVRNAE